MTYFIATDGGARGNPGPAAIGVFITHDSETVVKMGKTIGETTNNRAEYTALKVAWEEILKRVTPENREEVVVSMDSELVVKQMRGEYKIKDTVLQQIAIAIWGYQRQWGRGVTYRHVRREQNTICDALVNQALDGEMTASR